MMSNATKAAPPTKVVGKDDNTTTISKQLSWMLRHGAKHRSVGLSINAEGWIKLADILKTDYFKDDFTKDKLMQVIVDSNSQKPRYQLSADEVLIRAYTSAEQKALKESGEPAAPKATAPAAKKEASSDGGGQLRGDAPEFVPAATNPAAPMQMPMQFPGFPWPGYGFPQFPGYGFIPPAPARPETAGKPGSGVREWGKIKSFNAEKGYGFIESPRIFQQYGRDLFVHKAQLGNFKVGDEVHLTFTLNEQGYPQAKDLVAPGQAAPADKGKGKGKGWGFMMGPWDMAYMWGYGGMPTGPDLPRERVTKEPVKGEVVEWKDAFGWVKPDVALDHPAAKRRDGKIYVNKKDVTGTLTQGAKVMFIVYEDGNGLGGEEVRPL
eukprot:TRINITY_DN1454_c0_g2_i1.p1 TRINITY_DN1454_c0_g2~~TRINITY_DN1454_c0_g2_i1.p1  ORF type:complete len:379 (-),score=97.89 TRINITY_DN1454_c0_g2_i1:63-1199(-)